MKEPSGFCIKTPSQDISENHKTSTVVSRRLESLTLISSESECSSYIEEKFQLKLNPPIHNLFRPGARGIKTNTEAHHV